MSRSQCACIILAMILPACGYTVLHAQKPFGMQRIAVEPFQEKAPFGIAPELTRELSQKLAASGVTLTNSPSAADGVLRGTITTSSTRPAPTGQLGAPIPSYQVRLVMEVELRDSSEQLLWSSRISVTDDFFAVQGEQSEYPILATETNRRLSIQRLAKEAAESIHLQLSMAHVEQKT